MPKEESTAFRLPQVRTLLRTNGVAVAELESIGGDEEESEENDDRKGRESFNRRKDGRHWLKKELQSVKLDKRASTTVPLTRASCEDAVPLLPR
jgi:hypothetical protein